MRSVNLLPERGRTGLSAKGARRPLAALGAALVIGGMGFYAWSLHGEVGAVTDQVTRASAERDALRVQVSVLQRAQAGDGALDLERGAVVALAQGRVNYERLVRDLVTVMPRSIWLANLKAEVAASAAVPAAASAAGVSTGAPVGLHLDGFAPDHRQVALLMTRVRTVKGLGEPYLTSSEAQDQQGTQAVHFVIDAPIDQRAQDRPTITPVATSGVTP